MPGTFLPPDYQVPQSTGKYMKLRSGSHLFRILSAPIMGWLGWTEVNGERKPLRRPKDSGFQLNEVDPESIKHFWAMPVWNYAEKRVQILELTQKTVQKAIEKYSRDKDWGDPYEYDLLVERTGEGLDTEYTTIAKPKLPLDSETVMGWDAIRSTFDLDRLFSGGDPFDDENTAATPTVSAPVTPAAEPTQSTLQRDIFALSKKLWPQLSAAPDPKAALRKILKEEVGTEISDWNAATEVALEAVFMAMKNLEAKRFAKEFGGTDVLPKTDEIPF